MMKAKKTMAAVGAIAMLTATTMTAFAADQAMSTSGDTTVALNGTVTATTVTVTVPTAMAFSIDPNAAAGSTVTTSPATVTNNTKAPVTVTFKGMKAQSANSCKVVAQDTVTDWTALGTAETESKIALGLKVGGGSTMWSPAEGGVPAAAGTFDVAGTSGTAQISLDVKHGNNWSKAASPTYDMYLSVALSDHTVTA